MATAPAETPCAPADPHACAGAGDRDPRRTGEGPAPCSCPALRTRLGSRPSALRSRNTRRWGAVEDDFHLVHAPDLAELLVAEDRLESEGIEELDCELETLDTG